MGCVTLRLRGADAHLRLPLSPLRDCKMQAFMVRNEQRGARIFLIFLELLYPISDLLSDFVHNSPTIAIGGKAFPNGSYGFVGSAFRHS